MMTISNLIPDYDDSANHLSSFANIRAKTYATLYAHGLDKSPKGSVDEHVQSLVDLINHHPSFATLSSCSGRISLFDPGSSSTKNAPSSDRKSSGARPSGKGGQGGWLLVNHDEIQVNQLLEALNTAQDTASLLNFQMEPMLLHIAAASMERGQQLLQVVLAGGWRESGLIVTDTRVTVAVRSYSLALHVPLQSQGDWRPSDAYLAVLVDEANRRLRVNLQRIDKLQQALEHSLFQRRACTISGTILPDLNLWSHAAVRGREDSVLAFGGYGPGPDHGTPKRSDKVFRLSKRDGQWADAWQELAIADSAAILCSATDLALDPLTTLGAREGLAACVVSLQQPVIAIFGGRRGPAHPLSDLLLACECSESSLALATAQDVRGEPPGPRWAHTMTALSNPDKGRLAVVVGGRNEASAFGDCYILSRVEEHLLWEPLILQSPITPRFQHATVVIEDEILLLGGLLDPSNVLEAFSNDHYHQCPAVTAIDIATGQARIPLVDVRPRFGHSAAVVDHSRLLLVGGLVCGSQSAEPPPVQLLAWNDSALECLPVETWGVNFGSMVGHSAVAFDGQVLLLGGGVHGFGFAPCLAKSYAITVDVTRVCPSAACRGSNTPKTKAKVPASSHVVYVAKNNAKALKTALETAGFYDKTRRMAAADSDAPLSEPALSIAVPITEECRVVLEDASMEDYSWLSIIEGTGRQILPESSATFARKQRS